MTEVFLVTMSNVLWHGTFSKRNCCECSTISSVLLSRSWDLIRRSPWYVLLTLDNVLASRIAFHVGERHGLDAWRLSFGLTRLTYHGIEEFDVVHSMCSLGFATKQPPLKVTRFYMSLSRKGRFMGITSIISFRLTLGLFGTNWSGGYVDM